MGDVIEKKRRYYSGVSADKATIPAGGKALGDRYYATDTGILYFWDTANWIIIPLNVITAGMLQTDSVETLKIKNLNVTEGKLGPLACAEAKIDNLAISAEKLQTDSVETLKIKALNVTPDKASLGFGRYVPVPTSTWQYAVGDLTADGTWKVNALDFSAIVPAGAIGISLRVSIVDDAVDSVLGIRHDAGSSVSLRTMRTQVANLIHEQTFDLPIESDRLMDYNLSNLAWTGVDIAVIGYFI